MVTAARFDLVDNASVVRATLQISTLPSAEELHGQPALRQLAKEEAAGLEVVQLLEGAEYLFEITTTQAVKIDKTELFVADDRSGRRGRLKTKLYTGRIEVRVELGGEVMRPIAFEVRSSKLTYLADYRWMLESIAELSASLVLERFAPNAQRLAISDAKDADSLYQRFVFLRGLLEGERLSAALRRITSQPYVQWERIEEPVSPGRGIRSGSAFLRELQRPGPRQEWPTSPHPALNTVPRVVTATRTEETLDNIPNRFVLFALEEWLALASSMLEVLEVNGSDESKQTSAVQRGLSEGRALVTHLQDLIRSPIFRDVGPLTEFPVANQVLQKKEGYREVLNAYLLVQLGSTLAWEGGEDVFGGGQRNVATLYEYWVFLELAKIISDVCHTPLDLASLVAESKDGLHLLLKREKANAVTGEIRRLGRAFKVELHFNQQFAPGPNGTWTRTLRPDCSLHIVPLHPAQGADDIWLHFDAKYRVSKIADVLGDDEEASYEAKTDDIYKMHTYRDAIVRAAGAYVVFPGTEVITREQYEEVLPGLGAFPLRPSQTGSAEGSAAIRAFLDRAFDHVATQASRHERARFWRRTSIEGPTSAASVAAATFLTRPPADTPVLLGYVKSPEHHHWIASARLYNLRADPQRAGAVGLRGPELGVSFVALYGAVSEQPTLFAVIDEPLLHSAQDLEKLKYPVARGHLYFCLRLEAVASSLHWLTPALSEVVALRLRGKRPLGHPIVTDWLTLTATG